MSDEIEDDVIVEDPIPVPAPDAGWRLVDLPKLELARDRFDVGLDMMLLDFASEENPDGFRKRWARRLIDEPQTRQRVVTAAATLARGRTSFQEAATAQTPLEAIPMSDYLEALGELVQIWSMTETRPTNVGVVR
jgi:hypothetical protein